MRLLITAELFIPASGTPGATRRRLSNLARASGLALLVSYAESSVGGQFVAAGCWDSTGALISHCRKLQPDPAQLAAGFIGDYAAPRLLGWDVDSLSFEQTLVLFGSDAALAQVRSRAEDLGADRLLILGLNGAQIKKFPFRNKSSDVGLYPDSDVDVAVAQVRDPLLLEAFKRWNTQPIAGEIQGS